MKATVYFSRTISPEKVLELGFLQRTRLPQRDSEKTDNDRLFRDL